MSTLQQRVREILNNGQADYTSAESEADAVDSIFDLLQKAELDLKAAQTRVDDLKWKLAKAREHQS